MRRATPALRVYRSNRTERLAERLAELVAEPPGGPFEPETIVVQGHGMAVWLSHELATRHRIVANTEFVYPRDLVVRAFRSLLGDEALAASARSEQAVFWAVLAALPGLLAAPEFERLGRYLGTDPSGMRRFGLAERIAAAFDQYVIYRPEMVRGWDRGEDGGVREDQGWQPILWRAIGEHVGRSHFASLEAQYRSALKTGKSPTGLPKRIALFGVSSLPPLFVRVVAGLARHAAVHLFLFAPSPHDYWSYARTTQIALALEEGPGPEALHLEVGSPLVASNGALGAEFEAVLEQGLEEAQVARIDVELFEAPDAPGMLGALQRAVYELSADPPPGAARPLLAADDLSVGVHSCHGPMREVEVLHDQLLELLTRVTPPLLPRDVVVMMPDVDLYAPVIEAVFDRHRKIPYRISDRSVRKEAPVVDAFGRLLGLVGGRLEASAVLDLLAEGPVARHFDLSPDDLDQVATWVVSSGIRWGIDAEHRGSHDQPEVLQNTWRSGLDRMLLGYALPTEGRRTFEGVLPFDEIEGRSAEVLGRLTEFAERLFGVVRVLERARPLADWQMDLAAALSLLIHVDRESAWQAELVQAALTEITRAAEAQGFRDPVPLPIVRALVERQIDTSYPERGFLTKGVTFCAMLPMRSIPFKVVCLLGMNDGVFPRAVRSVEFDLLRSGEARRGDRDRRKDDRYLFLEAVMAARERLIVTYTGQSIRDNAKKPPSVVVSELLDRIELGFDPEAPFENETGRLAKIRLRSVVAHPLKAWSPRYFGGLDARLFSFDRSYLRGAEHSVLERAPAPIFFEGPLPDGPDPANVSDGANTVLLADLLRFYADPIAYLFERRLGIRLREDDADVPDREPLDVRELEKWRLGATLLEEALAGVDQGKSLELGRARGDLPIGRYGELVHRRVRAQTEEIVGKVREVESTGARDPLLVDLGLPDGSRLQGELGDLYGAGVVRHQFSRIRPKHRLGLWVRHVVLCAAISASQKNAAFCSTLIGRGEGDDVDVSAFGPVEDPDTRLAALIRWYRAGRSAPLRFAAGATFAWAEALAQGKGEARALERARQAYERELEFAPHLLRAFGRSKPGFEDVLAGVGGFAELALELVVPLLTVESCE